MIIFLKKHKIKFLILILFIILLSCFFIWKTKPLPNNNNNIITIDKPIIQKENIVIKELHPKFIKSNEINTKIVFQKEKEEKKIGHIILQF